MAVWRRKAIELFPELRHELHGAYGSTAREYNYYQCFIDLRGLFAEACGVGDTQMLGRIFEFTRWCVKQGRRAGDLENAAITVFLEHVFDVPSGDIEYVIPYIQSEDIRLYWGLWEWFTPRDVWQQVAPVLADRFPDTAPQRE